MSDDRAPENLPRPGALGQLRWIGVRRSAAPTKSAESGGEIVYNVRSVKDLRSAGHRSMLTKKK
jgi:hypothetical protein